MSKLKKIFNNVYVFSIISKIIIVFIGFFYAFILARYLGTELKGQLTYINTITSISVIICSLGVHQAYPFYKKQKVEGIKRIYVHSTFIMFLVYLAISLVVFFCVSNNPKLGIAVLLCPLLTYAKLITYLIMVESPNLKNKWEIICEVFEVIFLLVLYLFVHRRLELVIVMIVLKNIIASAYYFKKAKEDLKLSKQDIQMLGRFISFGVLPMFTLLMNSLNYRVDVLMLEKRVNDAQIGIYSVGIALAEKIWLLSDAMRDVLYSKLTTGKDSSEVNKVIRISLTICTFVSLGIILLGKKFIVICYGAEYQDAYYPLIIVLFGTVVMVYYKVIQAYNIVHHKQRINFVFLSVSVIINVILNYFFINRWGIEGAAGASLLSYTVCAVLFLGEYIKSSKSKLTDVLFIKKSDYIAIKLKIKGIRGKQDL